MDSAPGGWPRLLISLASPTQWGAPSFAFLAKGFEEVGRISNGKSSWRKRSARMLIHPLDVMPDDEQTGN